MPRENILLPFSGGMNNVSEVIPPEECRALVNYEHKNNDTLKKRLAPIAFSDLVYGEGGGGYLSCGIYYPQTQKLWYPNNMPTLTGVYTCSGNYVFVVFGNTNENGDIYALYLVCETGNSAHPWMKVELTNSEITYTSESELRFFMTPERVLITDWAGGNKAHKIEIKEDGSVVFAIIGAKRPSSKPTVTPIYSQGAGSGRMGEVFQTNDESYFSEVGVFYFCYTLEDEEGTESNPSPVSELADFQWQKTDEDDNVIQFLDHVELRELKVAKDLDEEVVKLYKFFNIYGMHFKYSAGSAASTFVKIAQKRVVAYLNDVGEPRANTITLTQWELGIAINYDNNRAPVSRDILETNGVIALSTINYQSEFFAEHDKAVKITISNPNNVTIVNKRIRLRIYDRRGDGVVADGMWIPELKWDEHSVGGSFVDLEASFRFWDTDRTTPLLCSYFTRNPGSLHYFDFVINIPQIMASQEKEIYFSWASDSDHALDSAFNEPALGKFMLMYDSASMSSVLNFDPMALIKETNYINSPCILRDTDIGGMDGDSVPNRYDERFNGVLSGSSVWRGSMINFFPHTNNFLYYRNPYYIYSIEYALTADDHSTGKTTYDIEEKGLAFSSAKKGIISCFIAVPPNAPNDYNLGVDYLPSIFTIMVGVKYFGLLYDVSNDLFKIWAFDPLIPNMDEISFANTVKFDKGAGTGIMTYYLVFQWDFDDNKASVTLIKRDVASPYTVTEMEDEITNISSLDIEDKFDDTDTVCSVIFGSNGLAITGTFHMFTLKNSYISIPNVLLGETHQDSGNERKLLASELAIMNPPLAYHIGNNLGFGDDENENVYIATDLEEIEDENELGVIRYSKPYTEAFPERYLFKLQREIYRIIIAPSYLGFQEQSNLIAFMRNGFSSIPLNTSDSALWGNYQVNPEEKRFGLEAMDGIVVTGSAVYYKTELGIVKWSGSGRELINFGKLALPASDTYIAGYIASRNQIIFHIDGFADGTYIKLKFDTATRTITATDDSIFNTGATPTLKKGMQIFVQSSADPDENNNDGLYTIEKVESTNKVIVKEEIHHQVDTAVYYTVTAKISYIYNDIMNNFKVFAGLDIQDIDVMLGGDQTENVNIILKNTPTSEVREFPQVYPDETNAGFTTFRAIAEKEVREFYSALYYLYVNYYQSEGE